MDMHLSQHVITFFYDIACNKKIMEIDVVPAERCRSPSADLPPRKNCDKQKPIPGIKIEGLKPKK